MWKQTYVMEAELGSSSVIGQMSNQQRAERRDGNVIGGTSLLKR